MHEPQSVHKDRHPLGSRKVLVGTEGEDATTSCFSSMATVQLPTSSPRTAQNTVSAWKHCPRGKEMAMCTVGGWQEFLAQCSSRHSGVRTHQHTWSLLPLQH